VGRHEGTGAERTGVSKSFQFENANMLWMAPDCIPVLFPESRVPSPESRVPSPELRMEVTVTEESFRLTEFSHGAG